MARLRVASRCWILASGFGFRYPAYMERQPRPEPEPATRELRSPVTGDLEDARVVEIVGVDNRPIDAEETIKIVERKGYGRIANRLLELHEICLADPDEPDIKVESLSTMVSFFVDYGATLPAPRISVSPDGLLVAEWKTRLPNRTESGAVAIEFLRHNWVRFVAFGAASRIKGTKRTGDVLLDLHPFFGIS